MYLLVANPITARYSEEQKITKEEEYALYSRTIVTSFSLNLVSPFVSMIALRSMNASGSDLGWLQSITNLLSTFLTPVFGRLSDLLQKRIVFIVFSTLTWGIPYIFLYWTETALTFVFIIAVVNVIFSLVNATWS